MQQTIAWCLDWILVGLITPAPRAALAADEIFTADFFVALNGQGNQPGAFEQQPSL